MQTLNDALMAGQRLMVGFDGRRLNDDLKRFIRRFKVGGLILFARNIAGPEQLQSLCSSVQAYALDCGNPPLFIAVDQEGGKVARLKAPFTEFAGSPFVKSPEAAHDFGRITALELQQVHINMNLAPVLDVAPPDMQSVMADRAFGGDPAWVAQLGTAVIHSLQKNGVMAVAKHFPGIGRTRLDSHLELPETDLQPADLAAMELVPFQAAVAGGVAGIMLSHVLYRSLDPNWPASLSHRIGAGLLRNKMGFSGLILTDDLDMGAVAKHFSIQTAVYQAYRAEADLMLICRPSAKIESAFTVLQRLLQDTDSRRISGEASLHRILGFKKRYLKMEKILN